MMMKKILSAVLLSVALIMAGATASPANAKAVKVEPREVAMAKSLHYVEPFQWTKPQRGGLPRRLYVEFNDGSAWVFTRCKSRDEDRANNCFYWTDEAAWPYLKLRGKTYYM